jgi:hypothetical protein
MAFLHDKLSIKTTDGEGTAEVLTTDGEGTADVYFLLNILQQVERSSKP